MTSGVTSCMTQALRKGSEVAQKNPKTAIALTAAAVGAVALAIFFGPQIIHGLQHLSGNALTGVQVTGITLAAATPMFLVMRPLLKKYEEEYNKARDEGHPAFQSDHI